jgi:hemolysin activation/secretion protein
MISRSLAIALGLVPLLGIAAMADDQAEAPVESTPLVFAIDTIQIDVQTPGLPALSPAEITVMLKAADHGYVAGGSDTATSATTTTLDQIGRLPDNRFKASAIRAISQAVTRAYNARGFGGITVAIDPNQIDAQGKDLRSPDDRSLRLLVRALLVTRVTTEAVGDRFQSDTADHPSHEQIIDRSPVTATSDDGGSLLRPDLVERYTRFLSRHPGRRVDAAVASGDEPDELTLRYLVQENKPWIVYATVSNTGTEQTSVWREQFGFTHYQLTGHDDILSISYSTAGFDSTHAVSASYELPLFHPRVRGRVFGSYSEFVASDVGFGGQNFSGQSTGVGGEVAWNFHQQDQWFTDLVGGLQYQHIEVDNELFTPTLKGREDFLRPSVGLRSQRVTETSALSASAMLDFNADDIAGTTDLGASQLGRTMVDADWLIFSYNASASVYLEPLINRAAWEDLATPASSTLAHEVLVALRGQVVFDDHRVIPQAQMTAGGFYSVRGYDESTAVGDNVVLATAEYRFHLPRALAPQPEPTVLFGQDFRVRPPSPRGRPDWDLIAKLFIDYGHTSNNNSQVGEESNALLAVGTGIELQLKRYLTVRVEWAAALEDAEQVEAGENRFHIAATLVY